MGKHQSTSSLPTEPLCSIDESEAGSASHTDLHVGLKARGHMAQYHWPFLTSNASGTWCVSLIYFLQLFLAVPDHLIGRLGIGWRNMTSSLRNMRRATARIKWFISLAVQVYLVQSALPPLTGQLVLASKVRLFKLTFSMRILPTAVSSTCTLTGYTCDLPRYSKRTWSQVRNLVHRTNR